MAGCALPAPRAELAGFRGLLSLSSLPPLLASFLPSIFPPSLPCSLSFFLPFCFPSSNLDSLPKYKKQEILCQRGAGHSLVFLGKAGLALLARVPAWQRLAEAKFLPAFRWELCCLLLHIPSTAQTPHFHHCLVPGDIPRCAAHMSWMGCTSNHVPLSLCSLQPNKRGLETLALKSFHQGFSYLWKSHTHLTSASSPGQ